MQDGWQQTAPISTYTIDLKTGEIVGEHPGITLVSAPTDSNNDGYYEVVVKLNYQSGFETSKFLIEYDKTPENWTVNIGDSQSNNGHKGDGAHQSNDAETQILNQTLVVHGNDDIPSSLNPLATVSDFVTEPSEIKLKVSNEYLAWNNHNGIQGDVESPYLYALNGQPDGEGPVNHDIYAAFNRVISSTSRIGSGVSKVTIVVPQSQTVELEAGEIVEDVNFGNQQKPGQIHGYKWNDLDGDGVWDDNEQGLADWTIYIDANGNGQLDEGELSTTTDDNGAYGFTDLGPGTYIVREVNQDGWQQTYPLQNLVIYNAVELEAGKIVEDVNFGNHLECAPPELTNPIRGQSLTVQPSATPGVSEFTFAADTFVDPDPGDVITYTAEKLIGVTGWTRRFVGGVWDPVATGWSSADIMDNDLASGPVIGLSFDPATHTFQTYTNDNQFHWVRVIATDNGGKQDVTYFDFSNRNGTVIDNYIVNANVFLDLNGNGQHDADEPFGISDENGNFNFGGFSILDYDLNQNGNLDPNEASIVAIGGIDSGTGLPLETPLRATPDATTVSLLTSLVADLVDRGLTVEEANTSVTNALSIPSDIGINSFDPIEATNNNELGGVETFAAMVQVQNVITQVAGLIGGASSASNGEIVNNVVSAITSEIQLGTPLDLTDTAQLQTIIDNTATSTGVNLDHLSAQAAEVIAAANEKIEDAVANSPTEDLELAFAKVQKVALGETTEDLEQAGAGTKSIDEVVAENTGSGLEEQIDNAQVLSEAPTDIDLSNNSVAENLPIGTEVGILTTVDPDTGETHTYSLVAGLGDTDNDLFEIAGDRLLTKASFDQDTQDSYSIRVLTSDGNGGVYSEEFTINVNEEITREIVEPTIIGEVGSVSNFNHQSKTINFNQTYDNPVVIAGPLSYNGSHTATVRIEEVTENGFTAFIQEPSNHDGWHIRESFSYLVLEAGTWQIEDGALVEVGAIDTNATVKYGWETIDLDANFQETPAIFSEVQSYNGGDFVRTRHRSDSPESFQFSMEEEEKKLWGGHVTETVGYVALSPGSGTINELDYTAGSTPDSVTHNWYNLDFQPNFANSPNLIAQLATYDGPNSAGLRYQNLTEDNVQVKVEEDTSKDREKWHTTEKVNFLAIEDGALSAYGYDPITGMAIINGSDSDEILAGTKGDDQINGGLGRDVFVFGEGEDVVSDFTDGIDLIGLTGDLEFSSLAVTQVSGDSVVSFGVESLTLIGVDSNLLTESDFVSIAI